MENQPGPEAITDKKARRAAIRIAKARYKQQCRALRAQACAARTAYVTEKYALMGRQPPKAMYTLSEELISAITHGVGTLLAVAALIAMVVVSLQAGDPWRLAGSVIFGVTLIMLYMMSTLYHSLKPNRAKKVFRIFDHCSIYLLIAGSYTPYTLVTLRGGWGWTLFCVIWAAAILGIVFSAISLKRFKVFGIICYIAMGWGIIIAIKPLVQNLAGGGLLLLLLGGLCYTLGILFYRDKKRRYTHAAWHFFVLAGSALHFLSIFYYVLL